MDINLLAISVGNSRLAVGGFAAGELGEVTRIDLADRSRFSDGIERAWGRLGAEGGAVVAASVNPAKNEVVEHVVEQVCGRDVLWVGKQIELPIKVLTEAPEKTGVDRVLNIAAAYEQMEAACVVVDAGTALTVDVCDDAGNFLGGAILPGASLMLKTLSAHTARLPEVKLAIPEGDLGRSTEQAMLHGVYHGLRGAVKELVELYATRLGKWPELIATGGDAQLLFKDWELVHAIAPDLTLYGIALAYTNQNLEAPE